MIQSTLCYIKKDGCYLMMHRVKKKDDLNHDKWIGVGGKFEKDESPEDCMRREIREETGLIALDWTYRGIVTFVSNQAETEYMHLFLVNEWSGVISECEEGTLEWVPVDLVPSLPTWEGDRIFLEYLGDESMPFFSLKLTYDGERLVRAELNGRRIDF